MMVNATQIIMITALLVKMTVICVLQITVTEKEAVYGIMILIVVIQTMITARAQKSGMMKVYVIHKLVAVMQIQALLMGVIIMMNTVTWTRSGTKKASASKMETLYVIMNQTSQKTVIIMIDSLRFESN